MITTEEKQQIIEEAKKEILQYIRENLYIDVDGYYESYSGQREHYHKVTINL